MPLSPRLRSPLLVFLVFLLLAAAAAFLWLRREPPAPADAAAPDAAAAAVPVVLAPATQASNDAQLDLLGSGMALRSVTLYPAVPGEVAELRFRAGQRVQAGQRLMRLVDRAQRLEVDLAAARLEAAQRLLARYEATAGTGAVPGSVIDEARSGVTLARIALRQAREALADRELKAPFSGVVGLARVEPGDRVAIDTVITTLDDRRSLQVAFEVPESYAARLRIGQPLTVTNPAFGGRSFGGSIAQIDSRVDDTSRNLRVRALVPNPQDLLRPGMSFQVLLPLPGVTYVAVPALALQWGREGAFVWVVRAGKAAQVAVRPVRRTQEQVLLEGPLRVGEEVVVEGVQRLRPGRPVAAVVPAVLPRRPASAAAPAASGPR